MLSGCSASAVYCSNWACAKSCMDPRLRCLGKLDHYGASRLIPSKVLGLSLMLEAQDRAICLHFRFSALAHPQRRTVACSSCHCGSCVSSISRTSSLMSGSTSVCSATARLRNDVRVPLSTNQRCRGAGQTSDANGFVPFVWTSYVGV